MLAAVLEDGTDYQQLRIKNEDPEINWGDINVPVTNYRPPRQDLRRASSRAEWFLSLDTGSFDAELVLWDPNPDAARGRLSAIYDSGPHQFKATWEDIEDECLAESLVEIKHNPSLISDEGVIWKRE